MSKKLHLITNINNINRNFVYQIISVINVS